MSNELEKPFRAPGGRLEETMLVSGSSDLRFVAAAVQTWSLPHIQGQSKGSEHAWDATAKNFAVSSAFLLLVYALNSGHYLLAGGSLLCQGLLVYAAIELLYFLCNRSRYKVVNELVEVPLDRERVELIKRRFLTLASCMNMDDFLSGWFMGAPAESVLRGNVEDFVAYGFYCRKLEELEPELQNLVSDFVGEVECAFRRRLAAGRNLNINFMAHLWEPLRAGHTPLCVHMASEGASAIAHIVLRCWGFRKYSCQDLEYWYRPSCYAALRQEQGHSPATRSGVTTRSMTHGGGVHQRGDSSSSLNDSIAEIASKPLVFIHGVGFGIAPYLNFLHKVVKGCHGHPMIFLDIPHVALRPMRRAKAIDSLAASTQAILAGHGFATACFVGHSYGTLCVSRICQLYPENVESIVVMDPVCMLTCYPQLLNSFVYKTSSLREAFGSLEGFANAVRIVFSRDLIISETFCRQFVWHSLMLWPEDLPRKAVISVSAHDDLVPGEIVSAHLESAKSSAILMNHPTAAHGGIFLDQEYLGQLIGNMKAIL